MTSSWNLNLPADAFGNYTSGIDFNKYKFPGLGADIPAGTAAFSTDIPAGTFGSFPALDGSAAGSAAFGGAAPGAGGLGSWGGIQALGGIANTLINQAGNAQGTQAGQAYLDFMADKRDADAGAAVWEHNKYITDQKNIARYIDKYRANDPNRRQANRAEYLEGLAGRYGPQLAAFAA